MAAMADINDLLKLVEVYAGATGLAEATISTKVLNDGKRIEAIRDGCDIGVRRLDEAISWFSANWPEQARWPRGIPRPEATPAAARA